tara:strand:+ start:4877 stop:5203 length:327 start_codon:yes stop_codon:yes gene_type:complete
MKNVDVHEGKSIAIISYLWWIGLIIAYIMNSNKKNTFASFHIRQMLGLLLLSVVAGLLRNYVDATLGYIIGMASFVLWVIGFIGATKGEDKKIPLVGDLFQDWFKNIG